MSTSMGPSQVVSSMSLKVNNKLMLKSFKLCYLPKFVGESGS